MLDSKIAPLHHKLRKAYTRVSFLLQALEVNSTNRAAQYRLRFVYGHIQDLHRVIVRIQAEYNR